MGEPIRITMDTIHDVFTFTPFTPDDVNEDGTVRADVAAFFPYHEYSGYYHDDTARIIRLHGSRFTVYLATNAYQFFTNGSLLFKGVPTRPMTLRKMTIDDLEPGMIFARNDRRSRLLFGVVEQVQHVQVSGRSGICYQVYGVDDAGRAPVCTYEYKTKKIRVFVECDPYVLK